jgi:hypothetical protein
LRVTITLPGVTVIETPEHIPSETVAAA